MHRNQEYLGVDVGSVRVGVARGGSLAKLAQPLVSLQSAVAVDEIAKLTTKSEVVGIVVGLPRSLEGSETDQTKAVRQWVEVAKTNIGLPFYWQDEALTSREAASQLQKSNPKHQTVDEHSLAAALILQDFLDAQESDRVVV